VEIYDTHKSSPGKKEAYTLAGYDANAGKYAAPPDSTEEAQVLHSLWKQMVENAGKDELAEKEQDAGAPPGSVFVCCTFTAHGRTLTPAEAGAAFEPYENAAGLRWWWHARSLAPWMAMSG
jgi:hypothetical protein